MQVESKVSRRRGETGGMRMRKRLPVIIIAISLLLAAVGQASAAPFYGGDIRIDSLAAKIDVTSEASITVEYNLANHGDDQETVSLTFAPAEATAHMDGGELLNPVNFAPGEEKKLVLSYSIHLPAADYQNVLFAPMLFFDRKVTSQMVKDYEVQLILPEGVKRLAYASMPYEDSTFQDSRLLVTWNKEDIYPGPLGIAWTTLDVDIAATKKATPDKLTAPGEIVEVEVTVQNNGDVEVRDITLCDSFFPGAFKAVEPQDEFELTHPEMSDSHLYWKKEIPILKPGEKQTCTYSIKVKTLGMETRLDSLVVLVDGIPVGTSNDIVLFSKFEEDRGKAPWEEIPTMYLIIGAAALVAIIVSVLVIRSKKKS